MTPIRILEQYLQPILTEHGFLAEAGEWTEGPEDGELRFVSFYASGGRSPGVIQRYPQVTTQWVGQRNNKADWELLANVLDQVMQRLDSDPLADCAMLVRALGEPAGPSQSAQGRPLYMLDFELITPGGGA